MTKIRGVYAIVDVKEDQKVDPVSLTKHYLKAGIRLIQLRAKTLDEKNYLDLAKKINQLKEKISFIFIINDYPQIAYEAQADGVHLGQEDITVSEARKILGNQKIIGKSSHSLEEAQIALQEDIDYLAVGAIFPSPTKGGSHPVLGLELLKKVIDLSSIPIVAIGGINKSNYESVLDTGATSIALISSLEKAENIYLNFEKAFSSNQL